ncbi:MAG: ABC transporter permease, partial [Calditrichaeota bacterium]|nr:ABC transporter permease [Calditrichota bacterium]
MFPNYLKTALRSLRKQKLFSLINLFGLAVGITVTILILLYVQAELSYDDSQENREQVYRVLRQASLNGNEYLIGITSGPFAAALQTDFPETIHEAVRVLPNDGLVTYQNHSFMENKFYLADGNFFEVFSFPFRRGDPATALTQPNSVVLTAAMARKYFGDDDPIGKTLLLDEQYQFTVTGVLADNIGRSHLDFDFMASIEFMNR